MASITAANAIFSLSINKLITAPQILYGFAADDIFDTESLEIGEVMMGVDGFLSAGYVHTPVKQTISLMADSPSMRLFEDWYKAQQASGEIYFAQGNVTLSSINRQYILTKGVMTNYSPISDVKKLLQPRKFSLVWESVTGVQI